MGVAEAGLVGLGLARVRVELSAFLRSNSCLRSWRLVSSFPVSSVSLCREDS